MRARATTIAIVLLAASACSSDATTGILVAVDGVPSEADRLLITVSYQSSESTVSVGDDVTPLAPNGETSVSILLPADVGSFELAVAAYAGDCRIAAAETGCEVGRCSELLVTLDPVDFDCLPAMIDAGAPLDNGRPDGGPP